MAKHKRILRDGQVSRGPARWARAAANAFEKPNSKSGRLYLKRTSAAYRLSEDYPETVGPLAHMDIDWTYDPEAGERDNRRKDTVAYYTCSLYCAAMVVQLDWQQDVDTQEMLERFFMESAAAPLAFTAPTRTVRCYCCGSDIKPN